MKCRDGDRRGDTSAFRSPSLFHRFRFNFSLSPAGRVSALRDVYEISLYDRVTLYCVEIASLGSVKWVGLNTQYAVDAIPSID